MSTEKTVEIGDIVIAQNGIFQVKDIDTEKNLVYPIMMSPSDSISNNSIQKPLFGDETKSFGLGFVQILCKKDDFYEKYNGSFITMYTNLVKNHMQDLMKKIHQN
tara:strand:- start:13349 stop:13663 length:315 start_codon:yes stop_codon:yes gene_type:complete